MDSLTPEEKARLAEYDAELAKQAPQAEDNLTPEEEALLAEYDAELAKQASQADDKLTPEEEARLAEYDAELAKQAELEDIPAWKSGVAGAGQSLTFGLADEGYGAAKTGYDALMGEGDLDLESYRENRDAARGEFDKYEEANPKSYMTGELVGAAGTAAIPGVALAKGASLGAHAGRAALVGAGEAYGRTEEEAPEEQLPEVLEGAAIGSVAPGASELATKGAGMVAGKVAPALEGAQESLRKKAASQAEKSIGLGRTATMRKELDRYLAKKSTTMEEGDLGQMLKDEGMVKKGLGSWALPGGKSPKQALSKIKEYKRAAGEAIAQEVSAMSPIATGAIKHKLKQKLSKIEGNDIITENYRKSFKPIMNSLEKLEGKDPSVKDLEKLLVEFENYKMGIADIDKISLSSQKPARFDPEDALGMEEKSSLLNNSEYFQEPGRFDPKGDLGMEEKQSLLQEVGDTIKSIRQQIKNVEPLAYMSPKAVQASKSRIGADLGKAGFNKEGKVSVEALKDAYGSYAEALADAATDKEKYKLLNKRYEIANMLEDAAEGKVAEGGSVVGRWVAMQGIRHGSLTETGLGIGQMLFKRYGNSFASAGFTSAESLTKLPAKSLRALAEAAENSENPAAAIRVANYLLTQSDEAHRKAITKANDNKDK